MSSSRAPSTRGTRSLTRTRRASHPSTASIAKPEADKAGISLVALPFNIKILKNTITETSGTAISLTGLTCDIEGNKITINSGTAINLVGNQFSPSATVTIGGVGVSAIVNSATLIKATSPGLTAGTLYDIVVNNGGPASVLPKGWLSDFTDVPQASAKMRQRTPVGGVGASSDTGGAPGGRPTLSGR